MKTAHTLLLILLCVGLSLTAVRLWENPANNAQTLDTESVYARVMRTRTIRCGYFLYPKFLERDLNSGKFSGIAFDVMQEIGKQLSLKIEWTEEAPFANILKGLETDRYDAVCFPMSETPGRALAASFTDPLYFLPFFLYAREGDTRFDNNYALINDPAVKVAIQEGEMSQTVKAEDFPKAQTISMTNLADINQTLLQVTTGKADVAMTEPSSSEEFMLKNPGQLRRVPGPSLRMQASAFVVGIGENALRNLLNTAIHSLAATGFIERTARHYATGPDQYFLAAPRWGKAVEPMEKPAASREEPDKP